jgi:endoglucanase
MIKKGVNLGSWLNPEGYILGGRNIPFYQFYNEFKKIYGQEELNFFKKTFIETYITEEDFKIISSWGAKIIRLPIHFNFIEETPYNYNTKNVDFLKKIFTWAKSNGLKIILDLHATCGAQSGDWHSDSTGVANLWKFDSNKERTYKLWEFLVDTFKTEESLYGYDILNEPVTDTDDILLDFYENIINRISKIDIDHKIFFEGSCWSQRIEFLDNFFKKNHYKNVHVSIHNYAPINFTYNFVRNYYYPGIIDGENWNIDKIYEYLRPYKDFKDRNKIDLLVGEFGINPRNNAFGEIDFLRDLLKVYEDYGFDWTYWTYKAVSNGTFPDGIMQYNQNPVWICREGNIYGVETYYKHWNKYKNEIINSWKTENFNVNKFVLEKLFFNY